MEDSLHFDGAGKPRMVDVSGKSPTRRTATAVGEIELGEKGLAALATSGKGPVETTAALAGIQATKRTWELIPLCHPLPLEKVDVVFELVNSTLRCTCNVKGEARTGFEMEAMTGAAVALLTVYDMLKAIDKGMTIRGIHLLEKTGGKSGDWKCAR
jgi:cyclic pyranopterin phosphate synthase